MSKINLNHRSNVNTYHYNGKEIVIYDDHRYILNVIFILRKNGVLNKPLDLVYFDYHQDKCPVKKSIEKRAKDFDLNNISIEEFYSLVEFELNPLDDDWLLTGMELDLINDAVVIGAEDGSPKIGHEEYVDQRKGVHNFYSIPHLSFSLGSRGCLGDHVIKEDYFNKIRTFFDYNTESSDRFTVNMDRPFILDFDLDCFLGEFRGRQIAWTEEMFETELRERVGYDLISPYNFISQLIDSSQLVTICREPNSCGGIGEANKILSYLDNYLFESTLNTKPYT
ncbi:MAG: hypothetical protein WD607_08605 [Candidatus Paceibacterota bacterium]